MSEDGSESPTTAIREKGFKEWRTRKDTNDRPRVSTDLVREKMAKSILERKGISNIKRVPIHFEDIKTDSAKLPESERPIREKTKITLDKDNMPLAEDDDTQLHVVPNPNNITNTDRQTPGIHEVQSHQVTAPIPQQAREPIIPKPPYISTTHDNLPLTEMADVSKEQKPDKSFIRTIFGAPLRFVRKGSNQKRKDIGQLQTESRPPQVSSQRLKAPSPYPEESQNE